MFKLLKIVWDNVAKADLKIIYEFFELKSNQAAKNVINDIIKQSKNIHFAEQYQVDEFLGEPFRQMIVRSYKIIFKVNSENEIRILQIFDCRQNPIKLKNINK